MTRKKIFLMIFFSFLFFSGKQTSLLLGSTILSVKHLDSLAKEQAAQSESNLPKNNSSLFQATERR